MATTTASIAARAAAGTRTDPLVLWHLLSLDAPTVATLWTWFVARTAHVTLPTASLAAMFLAVWILYAADRLLDARAPAAPTRDPAAPGSGLAEPVTQPLEWRHRFHHRHGKAYRFGLLIAGLGLSALAPHLLPAALHLYTLEGAVLVVWFLVLHATPFAPRLPKEFVVGIFFAAATFIPTVARQPVLRLPLAPAAILFAALCTLNGLFIHAWEQTRDTPPSHPLTRLGVASVPALALIASIAATALALSAGGSLRPIPIACGLAALLLLALHTNRGRLERTTLRAAADLVLLTPLLLVPFLR